MKTYVWKLTGFLLFSLVFFLFSPQIPAEDPPQPPQQLLTGFTGVATGQSARLTVVNVSGRGALSSQPVFVELTLYDAGGNILAHLKPSDPCLPGQSYSVAWINPAASGTTPRFVRAAVKVRSATDLLSFQAVFVKGSLEIVDSDGTTRIWYPTVPFFPSLSALFPPRPVYPLLPGLVNVSSGQSLVYTFYPLEPAPPACLPEVKWLDAQGNPASSARTANTVIPLAPHNSADSQSPFFFSFTPTTPGQYRPVVSFAGCPRTAAPSAYIASEMLLDNATGTVITQWSMAPSCYPSSSIIQ